MLTPNVTVSGSTVGGSHEPGEVGMLGTVSTASLWYYFTPSTSGTAMLSTLGSPFDTIMGRYSYVDTVGVPATMSSLTNVS